MIATACILLSVRAGAQPSVDALARDVERAEAVRAVKTLQRTYAQYSQYGLWNEMAALFADDGRLKGVWRLWSLSLNDVVALPEPGEWTHAGAVHAGLHAL